MPQTTQAGGAASVLNPLWPDAEWDVSGAFSNDRELLLFHDFFRQVFGVRVPALVHGAPLCLWNSGRVLPKLICTAEQIRDAGLAYTRRGISVDLTFSNHLLTEKHLADETGNAILKFFERNNPARGNGVIMASDALYGHVKKNYPTLRTVSSIIKVTVEHGRGKLDYYRRLAERYDKVMIHPDDAWNFDLLEKLEDKSRYEILVNEYCVRNCRIRHLHYRSLSNSALDYFGAKDTEFDKLFPNNGCSDMRGLMCDPDHGSSALALDEIRRLHELGFRKFKVQGRGMANAGGSIFDLLRLTLRDDAPGENFMHRAKLQFLEALATLNPKI